MILGAMFMISFYEDVQQRLENRDSGNFHRIPNFVANKLSQITSRPRVFNSCIKWSSYLPVISA